MSQKSKAEKPAPKQAAQPKAPKPPKGSKPARAPKTPGRRAPLLLETTYLASLIAVLTAGAVTAGLSLLAGVEAWLVAVRAGLAILTVGLVLWSLNYRLMHGLLDAAVQEAREKQPNETPAPTGDEAPASSLEWKA